MSGALKQSLASWRDAHGFGILCIRSPRGERFVVVPASADIPLHLQGAPPWLGISESQLRTQLAEKGFCDSDADDAVQLAREWATTITGSGSLWPPSDSN